MHRVPREEAADHDERSDRREDQPAAAFLHWHFDGFIFFGRDQTGQAHTLARRRNGCDCGLGLRGR
jgi:hypothetical protein